MSIHYTGVIPTRIYNLKDFHANGITLTSIGWWRHHETRRRTMRCILRSNGLLGVIRTTCHGDTYAVDVQWGTNLRSRPNEQCITTECKTLREAKSILFMWFKSHNFKVIGPVPHLLEFKYWQGTVSPFLLQ